MANLLETVCSHLPRFTRLAYFYGQMLGPDELQTEQTYFREKIKLHNRCLHGYGTVCGLSVVAPKLHDCCSIAHDHECSLEEAIRRRDEAKDADKPQCQAEVDKLTVDLAAHWHACKTSQHRHRPTVRIECGLALDCDGNELVVRQEFDVDLLSELGHDDRRRVESGQRTLYLYLCYCEQKIDPTRPLLPDACGTAPHCSHGKIRDGVRIRVSTHKPQRDDRCDTCCQPCKHATCSDGRHEHCVLLASIEHVHEHRLVRSRHIRNDVRRLVGRYEPTTITGISWVHGGSYHPSDADRVLGTFDRTRGIQVEFSREVLRETLTPGVVDLWLIRGGGGTRGQIEHLVGQFVDLPQDEYVKGFTYRHSGRERVNEEDRILIILRTDFILDKCCKPVDGNHVGGRVPLLPHSQGAHQPAPVSRLDPHHCRDGRYGLWTSGNGQPGGTFESWFFVAQQTGAQP